MEFEWDPDKAISNEHKHSVSFIEASQAFGDALSISVWDPDHAMQESRFLLFGQSANGKSVVVAYTERGARIRIISARSMTPKERKVYEQ